MSNTPETDAAVIASNGQWSFVLKETCQRLERERDEALELVSELKRKISDYCDEQLRLVFENRRLHQERDEALEHLRDIKEYGTEEINAAVELRQKLAAALVERDKAREDATNYYARIGELESERDEAMEALSGRTVSCAACNHAAIERDEAREKAERYRLEANAMMLQRDEAQKHLRDIEEYGTEEINAAVELRQKLADALLERDEARNLVDHYREQKDLLPISWDV